MFSAFQTLWSVSGSSESEVQASKQPWCSCTSSWQTRARSCVGTAPEELRESREVADARQRNWTNTTNAQVFLTQWSFLRRQGAQKKREPSFKCSMSLLEFSCWNLGSWWWMVYLSHQLHSTFTVIIFYRLIDFYILSKSGSYTTWFII